MIALCSITLEDLVTSHHLQSTSEVHPGEKLTFPQLCSHVRWNVTTISDHPGHISGLEVFEPLRVQPNTSQPVMACAAEPDRDQLSCLIDPSSGLPPHHLGHLNRDWPAWINKSFLNLPHPWLTSSLPHSNKELKFVFLKKQSEGNFSNFSQVVLCTNSPPVPQMVEKLKRVKS